MYILADMDVKLQNVCCLFLDFKNLTCTVAWHKIEAINLV